MAVRAEQVADRERAVSAAGVALFHALLLYFLIHGLGPAGVREIGAQLKLFDVAEEPPPPVKDVRPAEARLAKARKREGAASPKNLKATPSPIVAPPPEIRLFVPPPVIAAPVAGPGAAPSAGASNVPGPGTGSGGRGTGTGSGASGDGPGGGGDGGDGTALRWVKGALRSSDYPQAALDAGASGTVYLRFIVGIDGRVGTCTVTRSSGNPALDETTCRLIKRRFRYKPSRDASGRPYADVVTGTHVWELWRRPDEIIEEEEGPPSGADDGRR